MRLLAVYLMIGGDPLHGDVNQNGVSVKPNLI